MSSICQKYCDFALSSQEREVAAQIALARRPRSWFMLKDIREEVSIKQYSHLSAVITRLVKKGVLTRLARGKYKFGDRRLMRHFMAKR